MTSPKKKENARVDVQSPPKTVDVNYIKTAGYRSYYVDGIFGGVTPTLMIYMELFLQRQVTPQIIEHEVGPEGRLGKELKRVGKQGIVREIEAGIVMNLETAKILRNWLDDRIKQLDRIIDKKEKISHEKS
jgi:hypothetical protein